MKKTAFIILGVVIAAQFLIPVSMILKHERVLRTGELYRFKTRPIDPADPFQGRYIWLGFEDDYISGVTENEPAPEYNERVFVTLGTDPEGFCQLTNWSRTQPETGAFLKLKSNGSGYRWDSEVKENVYLGLRFKLPFTHFYMDETKAPRAEKLVREGTRTTNCWASVRVLNGAALIEDVYVEGTPIRELSGYPEK